LSGHLGDLNVYIHTQFSGEEPELCIEESAIFKQLYLLSYYRKKMNDTLRGIDDSVAWITLKEGDSVITKTNKNEVAKTWRGLMNDTKNELKTLADKYLIYSAAPVQVLEID
jgi:hypothetical protein